MEIIDKNHLNKEIALALGWTNLYETKWVDDELSQRLVYALCGTSPDGKHDQVVPAYTDDLNAVADALPDGERGCNIELSTKWKGKFRAVIRDFAIRDNINSHAYVADADTRHEAAARALLAWAKAQGSPEAQP